MSHVQSSAASAATKNTATPLTTHSGVPPPPAAIPLHPDAFPAAVPLLPVPPPSHGAAAGAPLVTPGRPASGSAAKAAPAARRPTSGTAAAELKTCNCRNSKCLKLYCECFASGRYCCGCNCSNCMNNTAHEAERSKAIENILERNPNAFRPKIQFQPGQDGTAAAKVTRHSKGCSCRKSHCLKKYCECFQAGIFCARSCRCKDCRNYDGSAALALVVGVDADGQLQGRAPAAAAGVPDAKRPRTAAPAHVAAGENGAHYAPERRDPARDAIVNSRERKAHEVLARMLTTLHSEAVAHEQRQREAGTPDPAVQSEPADGAATQAAAAPAARDDLSGYYVRTEGTLLGEFGSFLGRLADRIDEQVEGQGAGMQ